MLIRYNVEDIKRKIIKHKRRKEMRDTKGITLIALVITVIVMLILAGIAMYFTIGEEGILSKIVKSSEEYENAYEKEKTDLDNLYSEMLIAVNDEAKVTILYQI